MITLPDAVYKAARKISEDPALVLEIFSDWMVFELAAEGSRKEGAQRAPKDSPEYSAALSGLRAFLAWAGNDGAKAKQLVTLDWVQNGVAHNESMPRVDRAVSGVAYLEQMLSRCSNGSSAKKREKSFLPLLAWRVIEWYRLLNLPRPALSINSPAVNLMSAIARANKIELGPDAYRKALSAALKSCID